MEAKEEEEEESKGHSWQVPGFRRHHNTQHTALPVSRGYSIPPRKEPAALNKPSTNQRPSTTIDNYIPHIPSIPVAELSGTS